MDGQPSDVSDHGTRDARLSGWYRTDTGELYTGVPVGPEDVVVDVGCGDGTIAYFCAMRGARVILSDIDPAALAHAGCRFANMPADRFHRIVTDSNPLPLGDGTASVVICTEVIEHVDDCAQLLSELVRVGRPGARYLLSVPDPIAEELQRPVAAPAHYEKPNHIRIIQRDAFVRMVGEAGLRVESHSFGGFFWSIWNLFFWITGNEAFSTPHPLLDSWTHTWEALLDTPRGTEVKAILDSLLPKNQIIVARKP